jgi:hypothetical protein
MLGKNVNKKQHKKTDLFLALENNKECYIDLMYAGIPKIRTHSSLPKPKN